MAPRKGNWKGKSKEERQKELDELLELSNKQIEKYQTSTKDFLEYVDFMSKIHNYSPLNVSLIQEQFEGAVAVASYKRWQELGFSVQKGEKGIGIYAHTPITKFIDENGEQKTLREATPQQKAKIKSGELQSRKIDAFKKGYVFDVSQTNAGPEDLPKIFPNRVWEFKITGDTELGQLEKGVNGLANHLGIEMVDMQESIIGELGGARGAYIQTIDGHEEIALNSRNTRTQNVATAIHELAHKRLHQQQEKGANYPTEAKEFQAELVSYAVCHKYGMDTSQKAIPYIAKWTGNGEKIDPKKFREIMSGVKETALEFMDKIDEVILAEREMAGQTQQQDTKQEPEAVKAVNQEQSSLKNSFISDKEVEKVSSNKKEYEGITFGSEDFAKFSKGDFSGYRFTNCKFEKMFMEESNFDGAVFADCEFNAVRMAGSSMKGAVLYSNFDQVDFRDVDFENANIKSSRLSNCEFSNANMLNTTLTNVTIQEPKIGKEIQHLNLANVYLSGATSEENSRERQKILEQLEKYNFNSEFDPAKMDLGYKQHYEATKDQPGQKLQSYFEGMIEFHQENGNTKIELTYEGSDDEIEIATIGENFVQYHSDTKQFVIYDKYGVTGDMASCSEGDTFLRDRSPENCDYVEAFVIESTRAYEAEQMGMNSKEAREWNEAQKENNRHYEPAELGIEISEPIRNTVITEAVYNLSDSAEVYYDPQAWQEELYRQQTINDFSDLTTAGSVETFYGDHESEIKNVVSAVEEARDCRITKGVTGDDLKEMSSVIAYNAVASEVRMEVESGKFEIPKHTKLKQPEKTVEQALELS